MQLFNPNSNGKTPVQLVDEGLERLSDKIRPRVRSQLLNKVKTAMDDLIQNHLSEYLELKDDKYRATDKFKANYRKVELIALKLKEWAGTPQSIQVDLESFGRQ